MGRAGRVNVKRKEVAIKSNQSSAAAQTHECARETKNKTKTFLTEPDFVRDVLDISNEGGLVKSVLDLIFVSSAHTSACA
jgi:hypothetical protein